MAAAAAITANYEIGHNLKGIQVRDPFFPRPMFSKIRNAMKLSFLFYDHKNYLKMAAIWVKRLYTFSRGVTLLWKLQIDVSITLLVQHVMLSRWFTHHFNMKTLCFFSYFFSIFKRRT